jgi:vitamin B12 transporter
MSFTRAVFAIAVAALAFGARATEPPVVYRGEEVVVTATRIADRIERAIAHTTVITSEEIAASGAADVPTLLRREAGIELPQSGGLGSQSSIFLRGTNFNHTLVLVDGVRLGSATTGATALDQIMLDQIERIEIVRGPASSLYGSDAIGGVIQIFTRKGRGAPGLSVHAGIGGQESTVLAGSFGGEAGSTRFHLGVSRRATAGFSAIRPEFIPTPFVTTAADADRDGYRNTTVNANVTHAMGRAHELGATAFYSAGTLDSDGTFSNLAKPALSASSVYFRSAFTDAWQSRVSLSRGTDKLPVFLNGALVSRFRTDNTQLSWQNDFTLAKAGTLSVALERLQQKVDSDTAYTRTQRRANGVFAGYSGSMDGHSLQFSLRGDDYSDFGSHTTHFVGYGYGFTPAWRATASIGTAFRAPSFNELFHPGFFGIFSGNPNLRPERSRTGELGVQYTGGGQLVKAVYFKTRIADLITFAATFPFNAVNVGRAENEGFELSYSGTIAGTEVKLSATVQDPVNALTGARLLRRAEKFGTIVAARQWGPWRAGVELRVSGARQDIHIADFTPVTVGGYEVVNFVARYAFDKKTSIDVRIDNAFDRDYMLVHGYGTQDRRVFVTFGYRP